MEGDICKMKKKISLLGATGSIGIQTLDIIGANPEKFELVSFSAGLNIDKVREIARDFNPLLISVIRKQDAEILAQEFLSIKFVYGDVGLLEVAVHAGADILVNSVIGSVGLKPTLAAIDAGITIALANKETLVAAGDIVMAAAEKKKVSIIPVDSEHSAIFQALNGENPNRIARIILTASVA
jgi:1-deoxy-D-xylulose-5-phosphate reductoisomerase